MVTTRFEGDMEVSLDVLREVGQEEFKGCSYILRSGQGVRFQSKAVDTLRARRMALHLFLSRLYLLFIEEE